MEIRWFLLNDKFNCLKLKNKIISAKKVKFKLRMKWGNIKTKKIDK